MSSPRPDMPIAYICEHDKDKTIISRNFIFWDGDRQIFCVRGLVGYEVDGEKPQYAYECETTGPIFDYLDFMNDVNSLYTYELFNIKTPDDKSADDITFEWLHNNKSHWLAAYDGQKFNKKRIGQLLRIIKNMTFV
jgi:hypothetical protein